MQARVRQVMVVEKLAKRGDSRPMGHGQLANELKMGLRLDLCVDQESRESGDDDGQAGLGSQAESRAIMGAEAGSKTMGAESTMILEGYRRDLIDKITIMGIRMAMQDELTQPPEYFEETRLLVEMVAQDLREYENKMYMAYGLSGAVRARYDNLLSRIDGPNSVMDKVHCILLMSTASLLEITMVVRQLVILAEQIVEQIAEQIAEQAKNREVAEKQIWVDGPDEIDPSFIPANLTVSEYR